MSKQTKAEIKEVLEFNYDLLQMLFNWLLDELKTENKLNDYNPIDSDQDDINIAFDNFKTAINLLRAK